MFGPSILVAPVYEYKARMREVYLPAGSSWYDFETFKKFDGGQRIQVDAPLEKLPLFIKSGSIIPIGPEIQYTSERKDDVLTLYVFPGENGSFTIYQDENTNYNYEKGQFSTIKLNYDEATRTITIGERQGQYPDMPQKIRFELIWVKDYQRGGFNTRPQQVVDYFGEQIQITI
jgi:alpha-D-xyloside xylohydrolase